MEGPVTVIAGVSRGIRAIVEIAAACAYFLSDHAGFTTGQVLYVCGGLSVGLAPT